MTDLKKSSSLTGYQLKYIAMATMLLDHAAYMFVDYGSYLYLFCRFFGRIAFPVYCFLLVEGFVHTSNRKSYLIRLILFALISEIPFDMAFFGFPSVTNSDILFGHQNVFFTLAMAFLAMYILEECRFQNQFIGYISAAVIALSGDILHIDYGTGGILVILILYLIQRSGRDWDPATKFALAILPILSFDPIGLGVLLAIPILCKYNGEKGSPLPDGKSFPWAKHLFYAFYPVHLLLLFFIQTVVSN